MTLLLCIKIIQKALRFQKKDGILFTMNLVKVHNAISVCSGICYRLEGVMGLELKIIAYCLLLLQIEMFASRYSSMGGSMDLFTKGGRHDHEVCTHIYLHCYLDHGSQF